MAFTHVRRQKIYTQIADQITESIRRGEFKPGDRLPSARELEGKFGASRPSVREALSALELAGIVETRTGQGTFVVGFPSDRGEGWSFEFEEAESPAEVMEVRRVLEPEAARLAAERATKDDIDALQTALQALRAVVAEGKPAVAGDIQFHLAVARASGNSVIWEVMRAFASYLNQALWRSLRDHAWAHRDLGRVYLAHHERTINAIMARDGEEAAAAMRDHLQHVEQDLFMEP